MTVGAARRRYLDVADYVLRAVAAGTITRGDRLPNERELSSLCAVSRSSVREALLALELAGVSEGRPGSGWYLPASLQTGLEVAGIIARSPGPDGGEDALCAVAADLAAHRPQIAS